MTIHIMKVIGVVGLNGSGKDEVLKYMKTKYATPFISVGDIVREIAAQEGLEMTRENLDKVTQKYFKLFGQGYFLKLVIEKIKSSNWPICGVSGVRSHDDVALLRKSFNLDFVLVRVYISDDMVRFTRMLTRGSQRDNLTFAQFLEQDKASQNIFQIQKTLQMADAAISNDGTLDDLHERTEKMIKQLRLI
jgi:dephospho-CoA kinase